MRTRRPTRYGVLPVLALCVGLGLALVGCGTSSPAPSRGDDVVGSAPRASAPAAMPTAVPAAAGAVSTGLVTILSVGAAAPELCLGAVAESYPPQCGGPVIVGFDWADHPKLYDEANGVRWGVFAVTGTFDGTRFMLKGAIPSALYDGVAHPDTTDFKTPCATPPGGWRVIDPATTNQDSMSATFEAASRLPGYADSWIDSSRDTGLAKSQANDPRLTTINVRVTDDRAGAEAALRKTWGGALCVTLAQHTEKELLGIQQRLSKLPGLLSSGPQNGAVEASVIYDDGSLQTWADREFGAGLVRVSSALKDEVG